MAGLPKQRQLLIIKKSRHDFNNIFEMVNISDWKKELTVNRENPREDDELGLSNPYSKATCLIMQLYSMEIGSPPLYAEINRMAREMDKS